MHNAKKDGTYVLLRVIVKFSLYCIQLEMQYVKQAYILQIHEFLSLDVVTFTKTFVKITNCQSLQYLPDAFIFPSINHATLPSLNWQSEVCVNS